MLKISPHLAAVCIKKCDQFVRIGLQRGLLPFGVAMKTHERGKCYNYFINPKDFMTYTGLTEHDIRGIAGKEGIACE